MSSHESLLPCGLVDLRCHRRIIADYLLASGNTVLHILGPAKIEPAMLTDAATNSDAGLIYGPRPKA